MASGAEFVSGEREDWLASGERVVVEAKPHWKSFAGLTSAGLLAGLALAAAGFEHAAQYAHASAKVAARHAMHGLQLEVLGGAVFLFVLVVGFVRWRTTRYFVTDQRVAVRRGLIVRTGADAPLGKVNAIRFRRGVTDRIFGTGTLVVTPGVFRSVKLWSIRDSHEAYLKIHEGQRVAPQPPVEPRFGSTPPQHLSSPFGSTSSPFAAPPPAAPVAASDPAGPAAPVAPPARFGGDGPPIPPWARDEE